MPDYLNPVVLKSETCKYITSALKDLLEDLDIKNIPEHKIDKIIYVMNEQAKVISSINKAV